jgi:hypothetical protein
MWSIVGREKGLGSEWEEKDWEKNKKQVPIICLPIYSFFFFFFFGGTEVGI